MGNYLYNGTELPALPAIDKTAYPYLSISAELGTFTRYRYLWAYAEQVRATGNNATSTLAIPRPCMRWKLTNGEWVEDTPAETTVYTSDKGMVGLWANYDVYYVDDEQSAETLGFEAGSLYRAKSEPIPVGGTTAEPIDPQSYLMGFRVGQLIRGMR